MAAPTPPRFPDASPDVRPPQPSAPVGPPASGPARPPVRPRAWWRIWRVLWRALAGLVLLLALVAVGAVLALRSPAVQGWLVERINAALDRPVTLDAGSVPPPGAPAEAPAAPEGLRVRITSLAGPLPFGAQLGLELYDGQGLWLRVPSVRFVWDWQALPGALRIAELRVQNATLLRRPQLPPGPPPEPTPPLTEAGLRQLLGQAVRAAAQLPGWLPQVRLEEVALENARLPADLLGASLPPAPGPSASALSGPENSSLEQGAAAKSPSAKVAPEKLTSENNAAAQATPVGDGAALANPAPAAPQTLRVDLTLQAQAGTAGAHLRAMATLAPTTGAAFFLSGAVCAAASLQAEAALTPVRQGGRASLKATASLTAALTPAPAGTASQAAGLPAAVLAQGAALTLGLEGGLTAPEDAGPATGLSAGLTALRLTAGPLQVDGHAVWTSPTTGSWLSGPLDLALGVGLTPPAAATPATTTTQAASAPASGEASAVAAAQGVASPLDMLGAPLRLDLTAQGPLAAPRTLLTLDCANVRAGGHSLTGTTLRLAAEPLRWTALLPTPADVAAPAESAQVSASGSTAAAVLQPVSAAGERGNGPDEPDAAPVVAPVATGASSSAAAPELTVTLDLAGALDGRALKTHAVLFAARAGTDLRAGLRELSSLTAGVAATGAVCAVLPQGSPYPALDGELSVRVADWQALAALLPGARLSGEAALSLQLRSQAATSSGSSTDAFRPPAAQPSAATAVAQAVPPSPAPQPSGLQTSSLPSTSTAPVAPVPAVQEVTLGWRVPRLVYTAAGAEPLQVRGLAGTVRLADLWGKALAEASLDLTELRQAALQLGAHLRAQGSLHGPLNAELRTSGFVVAHTALRWQPGSVVVDRLEARLEKKKLGFTAAPGLQLRYGEDGFGLEGLDLRLSPSGRLRAQGSKDATGMTARLSLENLDLTPWRTLAEAVPEGVVAAQVQFSGKAAAPGGDLRLEVRDLRLPNSPLKPLHLTLTGKIERGGGDALALRLLLDPESVRALGGSVCRLEARLPLRFGPDGLPTPDMHGPLRGVVRWKGAVGPLWSLVPVADQRLGGQLDLSLDLGGSPAAPAVKGFVQMDGGRYENVQLGAQLQDINLRVDLEQQGMKPGKARLRLAAADGLGGSLRGTGQAGLDGAGLDIVTVLDRLRPLRRRDVRVDLSGRVAVTGTAAAPEVRGEVRVNQGEVWLNKLAVTGTVTTLPLSEAPAPAAAKSAASPPSTKGAPPAKATEPAGLLDLRLVMPGRFSVEGYGLKSVWRADMHVGGTPAAPIIDGQVEAARGSLDFMGKNFKLSRGRVGFAGGSPGNPMLDLLLSNETPELTAYIALTGTARKLQLALRSEPEMPRDEILAQILFGKSTSELGRLENLRLAAAVAQLAGFGSGGGGSFSDLGRKTLGVDVLRLNTDSGRSTSGGSGENSEDMTAGASVEMGKYLTEELYVGVQQGMKQGSTAFIIQWELTSRANLELRTEEGGTWGGFRWKYNY